MTILTPGLCSVTLREYGIEWGTDVHVPDRASAVYARRVTEAAGLRVLSLGSYYRAGGTHDDAGPGGDELLDRAVEAGAPRIRIWAGEAGSAEAGESGFKAVVQDTRRLADLAAERGIAVAFEYHGRTLTDTPESTVALVRAMARENVGTYWQPAVDAADDVALASLTKVSDHLMGVHCFSWWPGTTRLSLSGREQLWTSVVEVLGRGTTNTDIMLEFVEADSPQQLMADAQTLTGLIDAHTR